MVLIVTKEGREMPKGRITINEGLCLGCGYCVHFCPKKCVAINGDKVSPQGYLLASIVTPEECTGCGICGWMCPHLAIDVYKAEEKEILGKGRININEGLCLGCGYCVHFCSQKCLAITGDKVSPQGHLLASMTSPENCTACGICGWMCPHLAIDVYKYVKA